jgi:hypothetical protein
VDAYSPLLCRAGGEPHRADAINEWKIINEIEAAEMIVKDDRPNIPADGRRLPNGGLVRVGTTSLWWPRRNGRHHRPVTSWYDLAARLLQSWPSTLRIAVLLLVVLTGTAELAAKIGLSGQTVVIALDAWYCTRHRRVRGAE